jgi:hypothetical protein
MPITINGSGTVTGISAGGLPDGIIKAAELDGAQTGTAPIYGCRAWVNFDGTGTIGTNQTIRGSGNVTSVLKTGTGVYTVNFTTAMVDANYAASVFARDTSSTIPLLLSRSPATQTSTTYTVVLENTSLSNVDVNQVSVAIFR